MNPHPRPRPRLALEFHITTVLMDDSLDHREPQPRPLPLRLGREKGVADSQADVLGHPRSIIGHAQANVAPWGIPGGVPIRVLRNTRILRLDGDPAWTLNGIPGIEAEIHEDLLQLGGIDEDPVKVMGNDE